MKRTFKEAILHRRTIYTINDQIKVSDNEIKEIISTALNNIPSAFNSQTTRIVLLIGKNHQKMWEMTKETLKKIVPAEQYPQTEQKIDSAFLSGYGTILYYEDQEVIHHLQKGFPTYADRFPQWSEHTSAMHQLAIWTMLEDLGLGASLQHYNPLIDDAIAHEWHIPSQWKLIAQMPFGNPTATPGEKDRIPLEQRFLSF